VSEVRASRRPPARPAIQFIGASTDADKIRFFGTLMPALMLLAKAPGRFAAAQIAGRMRPRCGIEALVAAQADVVSRAGDTLVFIHRWRTPAFDPVVFSDAKVFLAQLARLLRRAGYSAEPLEPLTPTVNLPSLAARAGLGNLSPFGLLVNARYGPRLIISGMRTAYPLAVAEPDGMDGCNDCLACVTLCPQAPARTGTVDLRLCRSCSICLIACPAGKGRRARQAAVPPRDS
jgi:epoxyqueuosine reductase